MILVIIVFLWFLAVLFWMLFLHLLDNFLKDKGISISKEEKIEPNLFNVEKKEEPKIVGAYRPEKLKDFIGQEKVKKILAKYINRVKELNRQFPHTIFLGNAGLGKTTLARILAKELNYNFTEILASKLTKEDLIVELVEKGGLLFLDEIHSLPRNLAEIFYPLMEDFKYENKFINPFTLVGATTELGEIIKDKKPFLDRFKLLLELENYSIEDLKKIAEKYILNTYGEEFLNKEILEEIARNSRNVPRNVIRLCENSVMFNASSEKDMREVLTNFNIIKNGFTVKDLQVLRILNSTQVLGAQGLASTLGITFSNYLYFIEPYLLGNGLIARTPKGRMITDKGKKILKELEKEL